LSIHLVQGTDPALRDREAARLIDELLGNDDRSFALDDHSMAAKRRAAGESDDGEESAAGSAELPAFVAITTALQSPPFMTAARVVVVREIGNLTTEQGQWLAGWIADPLDGVHLVLVAGGGRTPAALEKAAKAGAHIVKPATEDTGDLLQQELKDAGLKLAPDAVKRVTAPLGQDAARVPGLVDVLQSAYGDDATTLTADDVAPYLGGVGTAEQFALTNAIDRGDVGGALEALHRMLSSTSAKDPKPADPFQIQGMLAAAYRRLLALDDPAIGTKEDAAAALGMKSAGGARFRLDAARKLGSDGLRDAINLLAQSELDLRGEAGLDDRTVIEVLVARLAALNRRSARR
jgi:DNA polymerase-3 subunit delta